MTANGMLANSLPVFSTEQRLQWSLHQGKIPILYLYSDVSQENIHKT